MDLTTILILITIGLFTGIFGGMFGIGGGIVLVPALVFFLGFTQIQAQGTSLALLMLPVGILGFLQYHKSGGQVDFRMVLLIALGFISGSYLGSKISLSLPVDVIKKLFACLMIAVALKMLLFDKTGKVADKAGRSATTK